MQTLSYGFKKPQAPDKGVDVFPALEDDIQQLNDHDHNGTNSKKISPKSIEADTASILAAGWVDQGNGYYRQTITVPLGYDFDKCTISMRTSAGEYAYPRIEKVNSTSYYVYTNDNTVAFTAVYGG